MWNDYLAWDEEDRFELIEGEAFAMSPAPNIQHQRISSNLHGELWCFFKGKPCEVFAAPTDLKLSPPDYWNKYVFQAYSNHTDIVIFLYGIPDKSENLRILILTSVLIYQ